MDAHEGFRGLKIFRRRIPTRPEDSAVERLITELVLQSELRRAGYNDIAEIMINMRSSTSASRNNMVSSRFCDDLPEEFLDGQARGSLAGFLPVLIEM